MAEQKKRSSLGLVGVILLLVLGSAAVVAFKVPLVECPKCGGVGDGHQLIGPVRKLPLTVRCDCDGGKTTLVEYFKVEGAKEAVVPGDLGR